MVPLCIKTPHSLIFSSFFFYQHKLNIIFVFHTDIHKAHCTELRYLLIIFQYMFNLEIQVEFWILLLSSCFYQHISLFYKLSGYINVLFLDYCRNMLYTFWSCLKFVILRFSNSGDILLSSAYCAIFFLLSGFKHFVGHDNLSRNW